MIVVYTDASVRTNKNNQPTGAAGIVILYKGYEMRIGIPNPIKMIGAGAYAHPGEMEVSTIVSALAIIDDLELKGDILVVTDQQQFVAYWNRDFLKDAKIDFRNQKKVRKPLFRKLYKYVKRLKDKDQKIDMSWIKSHNTSYYNIICDELAGRASNDLSKGSKVEIKVNEN